MDKRQQELTELKEYIEKIDKETTLLLQNLQWDNKHLIESMTMVSCQYVASHKIPLDRRKAHEDQCYLTQLGYSKEDVLLPDPIDPNANTVVKLSKQDIRKIIDTAASSTPTFKRVCPGPEPLSAERLQQTYTADERRAIHDAVVSTAPACHDLTDLALASSSDGPETNKIKSRLEILAELRDMRRRRTKYRVAAKTGNYSDALRDLIKTQMELYAEAKGIYIKTEYGSKTYVSLHMPIETTPTNIVTKQERISPEADHSYDSSRRHRERSISRDRRRKEYYDCEPVIKQERISPEADHNYDSSRRHRERSVSRDRRRREYRDREHASKRRDDFLDKNRYRDKYETTKERKRYDAYQQPKQHVDDDAVDDRKSHDDGRKDYYHVQKPSASKDSQRYYDESHSRHSKHDRYYRNDSFKNAKKYDDETRRVYYKYDKSYNEDSSKNNQNDSYKRKRLYQNTYKDSDRYREHKHGQHYNVEIKEEKDHY